MDTGPCAALKCRKMGTCAHSNGHRATPSMPGLPVWGSQPALGPASSPAGSWARCWALSSPFGNRELGTCASGDLRGRFNGKKPTRTCLWLNRDIKGHCGRGYRVIICPNELVSHSPRPGRGESWSRGRQGLHSLTCQPRLMKCSSAWGVREQELSQPSQTIPGLGRELSAPGRGCLGWRGFVWQDGCCVVTLAYPHFTSVWPVACPCRQMPKCGAR